MTANIKSNLFNFPINPFPDVFPSDFNKLNKKKVTEDFVSENLKAIGWNVYDPFTDTGIDRIISKKVCPNGHTPVNKYEGSTCEVCKVKSIDIVRFVQVKTHSYPVRLEVLINELLAMLLLKKTQTKQNIFN